MSDIYTTAPVPTTDEIYSIGRHHGELAERKRITNLLTEIRNTWQKPVAFNYPKDLDSLIQLIQKGQQ